MQTTDLNCNNGDLHIQACDYETMYEATSNLLMSIASCTCGSGTNGICIQVAKVFHSIKTLNIASFPGSHARELEH